MNTLTYSSLVCWLVTTLLPSLHAGCPCHIPCTGKQEVCTCFGPCGDDGYGCEQNGEDHQFHSQTQCAEGKWTVQCIRRNSCAIEETLDDTNPFAAYEHAAARSILEDSFYDDAIDNDNNADTVNSAARSSAHAMSWFGGNWFDFWGHNADDFFNDDIARDKFDSDDDDDHAQDISIDGHFVDSELDTPSQSLLAQSQKASSPAKSQTKKHTAPVMDDLGHNAAGYSIIALPLYVLIITIVCAVLLGMAMCAGFVYCGLRCCCPLPPSSPSLTAQQRTDSIDMSRVLTSLTLGGSRNKDSVNRNNSGVGGYASPGVYHRMHRALHNESVNESGKDENEDEYADSEDEQKREAVTMGGPDLMAEEEVMGNVRESEAERAERVRRVWKEREAFAGREERESDIGGSEDELMAQLSALMEQRQREKEEREREESESGQEEDPYGLVTVEDEDEESEEMEVGEGEVVVYERNGADGAL